MIRFAPFRNAALLAAVPALALTAPAAQAADLPSLHAQPSSYQAVPSAVAENVEHKRDKRDKYRSRDRYDDDRYEDYRYSRTNYRDDRYRDDRYRDDRYRSYGEPVRRDTRVWRGNDGRVYCRKENGTTGLLIGGAVGGLIGNEVAGRGDRTLGAILGAAGGALLGREIDRGNSRCR